VARAGAGLMSWFRLDDQGAFHAKVIRAGNDAYGAWCRAGQWSSAQLTDGRIPWRVALTIGPRKLWTRLLDAGLCDPVDGDNLRIHDFLVYNPTAEEVRAERARKARNVADLRARRRTQVTADVTDPVAAPVTGNVTGNVTGGVTGVKSRPDPDPDPDPLLTLSGESTARVAAQKASRRKPAKPFPDDFVVNETDIAVGAEQGYDRSRIDAELAKCRSHWRSKDERRADWHASFQNWLRQAKEIDDRNPKQNGGRPLRLVQRDANAQPWLPTEDA
jgi:hypothetical protein